MSKKTKLIVVTLLIVGLLLAGLFYWRKSRSGCIYYYDQDGKTLLYEECG